MVAYEDCELILVVKDNRQNKQRMHFFRGLTGYDCDFKRGWVLRESNFREYRLHQTSGTYCLAFFSLGS